MIDKNKPVLAIINESTVVNDAQLASMIPAFQQQVTRDFSPAWGIDAVIVFGSVSDSIKIIIRDTSDEAGALGYHFQEGGLPLTYVFAKDSMADGAGMDGLSTTISHEILEMLADPGCNLVALGWYVLTGGQKRTAYVSYEVGDPVEAQSYRIGGVAVSDFVYPEWFEGERPKGSVRFDHMGAVRSPFELASGGYIDAYLGTRLRTVYGRTARPKERRHRMAVREMRQLDVFTEVVADSGDSKDVFRGNPATHEVHHYNCKRASCNLDKIDGPVDFGSLIEARLAGYDLCGHCFKSQS